MATIEATRSERVIEVAQAPQHGLAKLGRQLAFYAKVLGWIPRTLVHYPKETLRILSDVFFGSGALIPLYVVGLLCSYAASRQITTWFYGQSAGTYDHYFHLFLPPGDVLWSFLKVIIFSVVVILVHCYYGYTASGGPAGVGVAVGRAVRAAIVLQMLLDVLLRLAVSGATTTVRIAG